ncbi:hypothetical protein LWI29_026402 [Acer saccharum]|uniref:Uncharacterized protein n=1 Tax=Acer saccharum TaxID=4024 RepID=A0AA39RT41_ACESA|nr:hypothetical protein LWI29_026402 [Acer saccharum]
MAFDLGEGSTGICICNPSTQEVKPIMGKTCEGYNLSPLETMLNDLSDGSGTSTNTGVLAGWYEPNNLFSPQVLNGTTMTVLEMRKLLNQLATDHRVEYYVFGFNADKRRLNDREKFAFIRKQLRDLEEEGGLGTKFFTFVNEFGTTKLAEKFCVDRFPEVFNCKLFLEMHPEVKDRMKADERYRDSNGEIDLNGKFFKRDLKKLRKRLLDSNAACRFSWEYITRDATSNLVMGDGGLMVQKMIEYAEEFGYHLSPSPIPVEPIPIPRGGGFRGGFRGGGYRGGFRGGGFRGGGFRGGFRGGGFRGGFRGRGRGV